MFFKKYELYQVNVFTIEVVFTIFVFYIRVSKFSRTFSLRIFFLLFTFVVYFFVMSQSALSTVYPQFRLRHCFQIKSTAMSQSWTSSTRFLSLFFVRKRAKITELKHAVQPKWLDICKNVINTIHWQYKNAEFEKKIFLNSSKFAPVHSKNWISRRGSKRGWPPLPEPQFFGQFTP